MNRKQCVVCGGTGWMEFPHPDGEGGFGATAVGPCLGCVADEVCPDCAQGMMVWGTLLICVHCGFSFDEAAEPVVAQAAGRSQGRSVGP